MKKVLKRADYLKLIQDIIDTPFNTLDERLQLIEDEFLMDNQFLYDNLYKDLNYIISRYDQKGDGDLVIENGGFVLERGDFKLTGKQTNLHGASRWCWMKILPKIAETSRPNIHLFEQAIERFNKDFLRYDEYSPDYKEQLNEISDNLKRHRAGKKSKIKKTDVPLWLKYIKEIVGIVGTILAFVFRNEIKQFFDFVRSLF